MSAAAVLLVTGAAAAQAFGNVLIKRIGPLQAMRLMAWLSLFTVPQVGVASVSICIGGVALTQVGANADKATATPG